MRKKIVQRISLFTLVALAFTACNKEGLQKPSIDPVDQTAQESVETFKIKLQAVVTIGSITYDSIPAMFRIMSWDSNNLPYQKDTLLGAGVNVITLPKTHTRFKFSVNKWGVTDDIMLTNAQLQEDVVYKLGGNRAAKKLRKEESFVFVMNAYQPYSGIQYEYSSKGLSVVQFFQKIPQYNELQFSQKKVYNYNGSNVSRIDVFDEANKATGFTEFTYNAQGSGITHIHEKAYDVETNAAVAYSYPTGANEITFDYLYNNGNAMEYKLKIKGGNKLEGQAISSTGGGEGGTYKYDFNINPYAHMNMPDIFLSNLSKNNLVEEQKMYSGNIPSAVPYKHEYSYDNDGYPVEVVKHYKSYENGEHLYKIRTVYTYM